MRLSSVEISPGDRVSFRHGARVITRTAVSVGPDYVKVLVKGEVVQVGGITSVVPSDEMRGRRYGV